MTDKKKTAKAKDKPTTKEASTLKKTPDVKKVSAEKPAVKKTPADTSKQQASSGIGGLALFLALIGLGVGYFAFTQLQQQIEALAGTTSDTQENSSNLESTLTSKTNQLDVGMTDLSKQLELLEQQSSEDITLLQNQIGKNRRQWLIAEAEYLASVANTRLQMVGDVETAIVALQAADQRLKENGDPIVIPIRKQIAKEINILQNTEMPDIVGISSQLLALENAVSNLHITEPHTGTVQSPEIGKGDTPPVPENIQQTLNDAWENFSKLIVVRRLDRPMAALMTPEQVELIRKNLALKLESARLALINQNEALYTASIAISIEWINDYFDSDNSHVQSTLEQLSKLKDTPIKANLPTISLSLTMLRDLPLLTISEQLELQEGDKTKNSKITPLETL
jgi:uncharacterized protein HemX